MLPDFSTTNQPIIQSYMACHFNDYGKYNRSYNGFMVLYGNRECCINCS